MPALTSTRRYGTGCGSEPDGRNTKNDGRLTTAIRPSVEVSPRVPTDQQSATISLIHPSQTPHAPSGSASARRRRSARNDGTRSSTAAPWWPTSCTSDEATPPPTIRSRGTRTTATGFGSPPGRRVRARRIAAPGPRAR